MSPLGNQASAAQVRVPHPAGAEPAPHAGVKVSVADSRDVPASAHEPGFLVISGGTGSQGAALAYAASRTYGVTHERRIVIPARGDSDKVAKAGEIGVQVNAEVNKLSDMPGVTIVPEGILKDADGSNAIFVVTVPQKEVGSVLEKLPAKREATIATYNGVPPRLPQGIVEPDHMASAFPSFPVPGKKDVFTFGPGKLVVGRSSPAARDMQAIFGKIFNVAIAEDPVAVQWSKLATNATVNSIATIMGRKVMELRARMDSEPQVAGLVKGVVAEIWMVARRHGLAVDFHAFYAAVAEMIPPAMDHFTTLGLAFRAGKPLGDDIAILTAGVNLMGKLAVPGKDPIETPLCDALTRSLEQLQDIRGGAAPVPAGFYAQPAVRGLEENLLSADMLATAHSAIAAASVAQAVRARL
jgi:hypothetical protein